MNKKKALIIVFILIILCLLLFVFGSDENSKTTLSTTCDKISNNISLKKKMLIFVTEEYNSSHVSDTIDRIKYNYGDKVDIITLTNNDYKKECIKKIIDPSIYEETIKTNDSFVVTYNEKREFGLMMGLDNYTNVESYFIERGIFDLVKVNEEITFEGYIKNLSKDKYLLLIITDERVRKSLINLVEEYFPNYLCDIVNIDSDIGSKINVDVQDKYKSFNEYPQLLYFENGKLIYSDVVIDKTSFQIYKNDLNELLNKI